jgi:hypothetical protein
MRKRSTSLPSTSGGVTALRIMLKACAYYASAQQAALVQEWVSKFSDGLRPGGGERF